jgi:outer membrane cobalamin receptor
LQALLNAASARSRAWPKLAPEQVRVLAISQKFEEYGRQVEARLAHDAPRARDQWGWNWSIVKQALEHLFWSGQVTSAEEGNMEGVVVSAKKQGSNITVSVVPGLITRRRENVGEIHAQGVETSLSLRWRRDWSLQGAYLWSDSKVTEFPPNPLLVSKILPQVPQHRVSASLSYSNARALSAFVSARFVGAQYDDDLNTLLLGNFVVLDFHVSRVLHRSLRVYASAENIFDRQFSVAKTPLENIGAPRMLHAGLKLVF